MANLVKKQEGWVVTYIEDKTSKFKKFAEIEPAADFLNEKCGIPNDEIDAAIIRIHTTQGQSQYKSIFALFDGNNKFSHLDFDRL